MRNLIVRWVIAAGLGMTGFHWLGAADAPRNTHRLELANGEVLVGELVSDDDAVIVFRSQTWGELRVPKGGTNLTVIAEPSAEPASQAPGWVKVAPPAAPVSAPPAPTTGTVVAGTPAPAKPEPSPIKWKKALEAGYNYQSRGSLVSTTSTYVRAEVTRTTPTGLAALDGRYLYGEQNSLRNTDKLDVNFKLREQFRGRLDIRNDLSYGYDYLKELSHRFQDVIGLSYTVFKTPRTYYMVGPGFAVQYAEPKLGDSGVKYLGDVSHEFFWKIVDRVTFKNAASYLFTPEDTQNYQLKVNSVLSGQVTEQVSVNLRYEYEFEAIRPVADGRSDHRVFTTLGYTF
ncbi:MAG: DUF481 domain-containing protein [Opitutaceae bacterium]|jgi:putative salt-induced outer membrane protein YdiY